MPRLPSHFRKLPFDKRKEALRKLFQLTDEEIAIISGKRDLTDLSDALIETAIGTTPLPFGLATGFRINNVDYVIPMATEEPSVIAAASHGGLLAKTGGGFSAWASESIMTAEIYLNCAQADADKKIAEVEDTWRLAVNSLIPNIVARGGGYREMSVKKGELHNSLLISIDLDVCDAMGANITNTVAEGIAGLFKETVNGDILMAILTNASEKRKAGASFRAPVKSFQKGDLSGEEVCERIVMAGELAASYPTRAVTHNKGIMNGITALTLATGNDTRAVEAAAHFYAQREGKYGSLTTFRLHDGYLEGVIELPLPLGTVGGSIGVWPSARLSLKILGNPTAKELSSIAASLGLAQNLAALFALVTEGIQEGHMRLHAARVAYAAGARGSDIRILASKLWNSRSVDPELAKKLLEEMKDSS